MRVKLKTVSINSLCFAPSAPDDYEDATQRVTIVEGSTRVEIPVGTTADGIAEPLEIFRAELSNPSPGAMIGTDDRAMIDIVDADGEYT